MTGIAAFKLSAQAELFAAHAGPPGFIYQPEFLGARGKRAARRDRALPFEEARYRDYTAKRRIVHWGPDAAKRDSRSR